MEVTITFNERLLGRRMKDEDPVLVPWANQPLADDLEVWWAGFGSGVVSLRGIP